MINTTTASLDLKTTLRDSAQEEKETAFSVLDQKLKIENTGNQRVKNFFPFIRHLPFTSLDRLASELANKKSPLLALYQLWEESLIQKEGVEETGCHPLYFS